MKPNKQIIFMGMAFELVGLMFGAITLGKILDDEFHFKGLGIAALSLLVLGSWLYHMIILLKKLEDK
jgi:hypothetical protein